MLTTPWMLVTAAVTILAVIFYMVTAWRTGSMREKHGIAAPAVAGHPAFERAYRVQMNTLEAMPVFLPALWIGAYYFTKVPLLAPALGLVWIVGRIVYMQAYMADPSKRSLGFKPQGGNRGKDVCGSAPSRALCVKPFFLKPW